MVSRTLVLYENAVEEVATGTVVATTSLTVTVPATGTLLVPGTAAPGDRGSVAYVDATSERHAYGETYKVSWWRGVAWAAGWLIILADSADQRR